MVDLPRSLRRLTGQMAVAIVVALARFADAQTPTDEPIFSVERELPRLEHAIRLIEESPERVALEMRLDEWRAKLQRGESPDEAESRAWLAELERWETRAVETSARRYRMAAYATFAADRVGYERCRTAWETVLTTWRQRGAKPEQRIALLAWLATADAALDRRAAPPPLPSWGAPPVVALPPAPEHTPPVLEPAATVSRRPADLPRPAVARAPDQGTLLLAQPDIGPTRGTADGPESREPQRAVRPPRRPLDGLAADAEPRDAPSTSVGQPRVNLEELALRITSHNLALRTLEQELQPGVSGDVNRLETAWEEVRQRADRERDLRLFLGVLGEDEARLVPELESWTTAGRLLQATLASAQEALQVDESAVAAAELKRLRRLAAAVAERLLDAR